MHLRRRDVADLHPTYKRLVRSNTDTTRNLIVNTNTHTAAAIITDTDSDTASASASATDTSATSITTGYHYC